MSTETELMIKSREAYRDGYWRLASSFGSRSLARRLGIWFPDVLKPTIALVVANTGSTAREFHVAWGANRPAPHFEAKSITTLTWSEH